MQLKISKPFWQVLGLGTLAGMRSTSAPVIASHILSHHQSKNLEASPLRFMQSGKVATALKILSLGEIAGDKLPSAPTGSVRLRLVSGCFPGCLQVPVFIKQPEAKWVPARCWVARPL